MGELKLSDLSRDDLCDIIKHYGARIRELEQDAGRYQHVRTHGMPKLCPAGYYYADGVFYETAETAIDAARKEKGHG